MRLDFFLFFLIFSFSFESYSNENDLPFNEKSINFIVPPDVLKDFSKGSDQDKKKFCSAKPSSVRLVESYGFGNKEVPKLIKGFNSRMDNYKEVPFAEETGLFILRFSEVITDAWAFNDSTKKEIALEALHQWAVQGGLLKTKTCTSKGMLDQGCTEWRQSDGQDISDSKDFSTVQMWVMKLAYGYYFALAEFKPDDSRHKIIQSWIGEFLNRNKRARDVYFGLDHGWFYPAIFNSIRLKENPKHLVAKLLNDLKNQVNDDGSMKNRTTRGNRALWYHHDAMKESMITIEIARTMNVVIPNELEVKISKAGQVFIKGYSDPSSLDQWAKEAHNAVFEPGKQDFNKRLNDMPNGNSWFYIFSYRNRNDPLTFTLDELIMQNSNQAVKDGEIGIGLGCIYAVAKGKRSL